VRLGERVAIVTGAAHGIGRAICVELAREGARVWACDVRAPELAATRAAVDAVRPGAGQAAAVDVRDARAVADFVARVDGAAGRVDILVNTAGGVSGQVMRPVEEVSDEAWREIFAVNLDGAFHFTRAVAPAMKRAGRGAIVNISSGAGRSYSLTGIQAYASAKAGQIGLTRQTAHELGQYGITVNSIAPGFVLSNPTSKAQFERYGEDGQRRLIESIATRRLGTPEDIANGVLFFVAEESSWVTGQVLSIDGGHSIF
jgi:3-oxoacyl-[acyl-carrier protein] reductase